MLSQQNTNVKMKALVFNRNLQLCDVECPVRSPDEALIRVLKAGICNTDIEIINGYMNFHGILGHEFVGVVEDSANTSLIGKRIVGEINLPCYHCEYCKQGNTRHCKNRNVLGILNKSGAFAEYLTLPEKNLHLVPESISDDEAVFVEPLAAAYEILEQIYLKSTDRVLVLGDGKLGLLIARVLMGQCQLSILGKHQEKLNLLSGCSVQTALELDADQSFDYVIDATGSSHGIQTSLGFVKAMGHVVLKTTTHDMSNINFSDIVIREIHVIGSRCGPFPPAIEALSTGKIQVEDLISHHFRLDDSLVAFERAGRKDAIKVILDIA